MGPQRSVKVRDLGDQTERKTKIAHTHSRPSGNKVINVSVGEGGGGGAEVGGGGGGALRLITSVCNSQGPVSSDRGFPVLLTSSLSRLRLGPGGPLELGNLCLEVGEI